MAVEEEQQVVVFTEKGIYADCHINWTELAEDESDVILRGMEIEIPKTPRVVPGGDKEGGLPLIGKAT